MKTLNRTFVPRTILSGIGRLLFIGTALHFSLFADYTAPSGLAPGSSYMISTDKNLSYQQNPAARKIAIVVLGQGRWSLLKRHVAQIVATVNAATPGSFAEVEIPYE